MIKVISYEEQREQFFRKKYNRNVHLSELWAKRSEGTLYGSFEHEKAAEYGMIAGFYEDAIEALKRKDDEHDQKRND